MDLKSELSMESGNLQAPTALKKITNKPVDCYSSHYKP